MVGRRLELAAIAVGLALALDPARRVVGAGVSLALLAGDSKDGDVADRGAVAVDSLEDAGRLGLAESPLVAAPVTV